VLSVTDVFSFVSISQVIGWKVCLVNLIICRPER